MRRNWERLSEVHLDFVDDCNDNPERNMSHDLEERRIPTEVAIMDIPVERIAEMLSGEEKLEAAEVIRKIAQLNKLILYCEFPNRQQWSADRAQIFRAAEEHCYNLHAAEENAYDALWHSGNDYGVIGGSSRTKIRYRREWKEIEGAQNERNQGKTPEELSAEEALLAALKERKAAQKTFGEFNRPIFRHQTQILGLNQHYEGRREELIELKNDFEECYYNSARERLRLAREGLLEAVKRLHDIRKRYVPV